MPPCPGQPDGESAAHGEVRSHLAVAEAKLKALHEWQQLGLLGEQYVTALKLRVAERHLLGYDAGEQP
jgi:hypothetical protein